jgi:hypothetical protein
MKKICRNCHFLSKELNSDRVYKFSLNPQEREKAKETPQEIIPPQFALNCHMGVWDEGLSGVSVDRNTILNFESRTTSCFFFPYHSAMLFDSARELQKRAAEHEELKRSNFYTRVGLYVASAALLFTALVEYFK